jgi:arylsulfatase A-like enzyme
VPFVASWKGTLPAGRVVNVPVTSMDAPATALEIAGATNANASSASAKSAPPLDGASLMPLLAGRSERAPHETLFWRVGKKNALRHGDWKLVRDGGGDWSLFHLASDIGEKTNLAGREPERVRELNALWDRWNTEQAEPLWR